MKGLLLFTFVLLFSINSSAHEYYFAYAEMEWNDFTQTFQGTVIFTGHDLEKVLDIELMDSEQPGDRDVDVLMDYANQHLAFGKTSFFNYVGSESKLTGEFYLYIESDPLEFNFSEPIKITFNFLMDFIPEQQNKMTVTFRKQRYNLVFINNEQAIQELILVQEDEN